MEQCVECGLIIDNKDCIALNKKMLGRINRTKFLCMECLAEYLDCTEEDLLQKIEDFKDEGCTLFQ